MQPLYLDNGIPAAGSRLLQEKYRRDFASHRTADERTNGADRSLACGIEKQKDVCIAFTAVKRKTARLLQQPDGVPRFGKRSSHLRSV